MGKYDSTYLRYLEGINTLKQKGEWWLPKTGGWEEADTMGSYYLMHTEFQLFKIKRVLKMDGGVGCTTTWLYLMPLNPTLQND